MEIQFSSPQQLRVTTKTKTFGINPEPSGGPLDFSLFLNPEDKTADKNLGKIFALPGEAEIGGILLRSFFVEDCKKNIFKALAEQVSFLFVGKLEEKIPTETIASFGENIDVLVVEIHEKFNPKAIKDLFDSIEPRVLIVHGDTSFSPELRSIFVVEPLESDTLKLKKSDLPEDASKVYFFSA